MNPAVFSPAARSRWRCMIGSLTSAWVPEINTRPRSSVYLSSSVTVCSLSPSIRSTLLHWCLSPLFAATSFECIRALMLPPHTVPASAPSVASSASVSAIVPQVGRNSNALPHESAALPGPRRVRTHASRPRSGRIVTCTALVRGVRTERVEHIALAVDAYKNDRSSPIVENLAVFVKASIGQGQIRPAGHTLRVDQARAN